MTAVQTWRYAPCIVTAGCDQQTASPVKRAFRPDNNSPFAEHLTPDGLLCLCRTHYITFSYNFNRLLFDELSFCTTLLPPPAPIRAGLPHFPCHFSQFIPTFFIKTEIPLNSSTNFRAKSPLPQAESRRFFSSRSFSSAVSVL